MKIKTIILIILILFLWIYAKEEVINAAGKVIGVFSSAKEKLNEANSSANKIVDSTKSIDDKLNLTNTSEKIGKVYDAFIDRLNEKE